ncbi:DUF2000 family protein [Paenibacillus apiarius]|uniref:DUF2000 family protein n=1 Tax=Paenibacillus apiarius TaxID=46240 RepID=UPI003B3BA661
MIIDSTLSTGLIAKTAAVLALTIGKKIAGIIGLDVKNASDCVHTGITNTPIPILKWN